MFAVIYHWKLKTGADEEEFRKIWHEGTVKIYKERGSLGSSLHRLNDGTFLAYARWPNRAAWKKMMVETSKTSSNKQFVDSVEDPQELDLIEDLLQTNQYSE
jgi:hypothetical protein